MTTELDRYLARVMFDHAYAPYSPETAAPHGPVVIVGYHATCATHPAPGTLLATLPDIDLGAAAAGRRPLKGLVCVEHATEVVTVDLDGSTPHRMHDTVFTRLPTGISWHLIPAEPTPGTGRPRIATGRWAAGGRRALLPRSVTPQVPGAPAVVNIHDHDPHTGRRWL